MKKIFINLLYLLFLSNICSNVYAASKAFRDACIGAFSGSSSSAKDGTKDSYSNELRANIKVISSAAGIFNEEGKEILEIQNILMEEIRILHERTEEPLSIRLIDDIDDNFCHYPSSCTNSCTDILKRTCRKVCSCFRNCFFNSRRGRRQE